MSEIYTGVKFKFKNLGDIQNPELLERHVNIITKELLTLPEDSFSGSSGNVSMRTEKGILISSTGTVLRNLIFPSDFCEVISSSQEKSIRFFGSKLPSSESRLHLLIYEKSPQTKYCFHFHLHNTEKLQILDKYPVTSKFLSYGTVDLDKEASNLVQSNDIVVLRNHGILLIGEDFKIMIEKVKRITKL